ncbi:cytochrome c [Cesiribacter sp. SM1]|uniref:c-type cytochrome n=1 Tax=Cesiribacter sp. SM1 TaxID=2861196 RepID=UPI001CD7FDCA|nr:cytochrome c [Cesiribacter sp. SM1]
MLRKILKWTGLAVLCIIVGVAVATMLRQNLTYDAPYPAIQASTDPAVIEKGKHLTLVTKGCVHCHSPAENVEAMLAKGEEPSLAGGKKIDTPFGVFFIPNITPDAKTGIGSMTDAEIARVLRYGVKSNGEAVLPFMQGLDMSDEDMTAVISYLRSLKPVENKMPESEFSLIGRVAKAFVVKPSIPATAAASVTKH